MYWTITTASEYEELQSTTLTESDRSGKLANTVLPSKGKGAFKTFSEVLLAVEEHIVYKILKVKANVSPPLENPSAISMDGFTNRDLGAWISTVSPVSQNAECQEQKTVPAASCQSEWSMFSIKSEHQQFFARIKNIISNMCLERFRMKTRVVPNDTSELNNLLQERG